MPELILHVGLHKTGTTSIQKSLAAARPQLRAAGVLYPSFTANHSRAFYSGFSGQGRKQFGHRLAGRRKDDIHAYGSRHLDAFDAELRETAADTVIVSGEGISRLTQPETARLLEWLAPRFGQVTVVFFVRPPESLLHSRVQQQAKTGKTLDALAGMELRTHYREALEKYFALLPRERIRHAIFARGTLVDGDAVRTFLEVTGLAGRVPAVPVIRANASMSLLGADLLFTANATLPIFAADGERNPARAPELTRVLSRLAGVKFHAPRALVERAMAASRDDIAWLDATLGIDIRAHDLSGLTAADYHPGLPQGEAAAGLDSLVAALNGALLAATPPGDEADAERGEGHRRRRGGGGRGGGGRRRREAEVAEEDEEDAA